jgi:hypothetical protein
MNERWRVFTFACIVLWLGAFTFYAAVVVPSGTAELGSTSQGFVTARVTRVLNWFSLALSVVLIADLRRRFGRFRLAIAVFFLLTLAVLFALHGLLSGQMDFESQSVAAAVDFYELHRVYLLASTAQWVMAITAAGLIGKEMAFSKATQLLGS